MKTRQRKADPDFEEDVKRILGDRDGVLRSTPSRAELEAYKELCGLLWGYRDDAVPGGSPLYGALAGHVITRNGGRIEVRSASWGGQALEFVPWPRHAPECRIWYLLDNGTEYLVAMTDASDIEDGHFPELADRIGPRIRELFPGSYIEQHRGG